MRLVRQRKLQGGSAKRHAIGVTDGLNRRDPGHPMLRGRAIVEAQLSASAHAGGQDAGVENAAQRNAHTKRLAQRQQLRQSAVINQAVSAGQQQAVDASVGTHATQHIQADLHVIHTQADVAQQALPALRVQFGQRLVQHLLEHWRVVRTMVGGVAVVHKHRVQTG